MYVYIYIYIYILYIHDLFLFQGPRERDAVEELRGPVVDAVGEDLVFCYIL